MGIRFRCVCAFCMVFDIPKMRVCVPAEHVVCRYAVEVLGKQSLARDLGDTILGIRFEVCKEVAAAPCCCCLLLLPAAAACCCCLLLLPAAAACCCSLLLLLLPAACCCLLLLPAAACCCCLLLLPAAVACCCCLLLLDAVYTRKKRSGID